MIQLLSGDCLEVMKDLSDNSIDCFICDLPYGQLTKTTLNFEPSEYAHGNRKITGCPWDVKIDLDAFWKEVSRLARNDNTPVIHFCNTRFGIDLINSNPKWFRYDLVWNKERGVSFLLANKQPMKSHEMIYVFSKKAPYYKRIDIKTDKGSYVAWGGCGKDTSSQYGVERIENFNERGENGMRCPLSVINMPNAAKKGGHPTEKSVELYKWLLSRYCPDGGTVLDPTAGSFNSIRAAQELGFNGIGIEKDKTFYDNAVKAFAE
jgi:site-specific DNA-methyltransferase (adenine-specific)